MAKKIRRIFGDMSQIHCACLIHDTAYDFEYVHKLYRSLCRNLTPEVILHVYTESNRLVPSPYIKHCLQEWPDIRGPKKSWWYKVQLFNSDFYRGPMLYFDLDTVIINNIDWIWQKSLDKLWAIRDFKYLFKSKNITLNSSIMWFDTKLFDFVYKEFDYKMIAKSRQWHGDQDYINSKVPSDLLSLFDVDKIYSYRWQLKEGGFDFKTRKFKQPGKICYPPNNTSVLVFHGRPNPHEENHPVISDNWY